MKIEDFKTISMKHIETCKKLVEDEGVCSDIFCCDCPFDFENASNCESCVNNEYSTEDSCLKKNLVAKQSAKAFLKMCEEKNLCQCKDYEFIPSYAQTHRKII